MALIGFVLGLFFWTAKASFFLYSFVINEFTFIFGISGIGFVLALYWVCIGFVLGLNWVCFHTSAKSLVFIILCYKRSYVHLGIQQIGFVLQNRSILIERSSLLIVRGS